nr:unnamed protein product [Callosobruchus chinensis]CAH7763635.1 unnamed protein product [Callosobruchus chinensis]
MQSREGQFKSSVTRP